MAMLPPGGLPEIVFSFDTSGSMSGCLIEVRGHLQDLIQRLQEDIPAIRIAVFAHGDYCDKNNYVTKFIDFTDDVKKLCEFADGVTMTSGGESDEFYELVLHQVQHELSWTAGSNRALVMIGDADPHGPNYPDNKLKLDWKVETSNLANMGVKIYAVQCGNDKSEFYKTMATMTSGHLLKLSNFSNMLDFFMAICYRERGDDFLQVYEKEVRARCGAKISTDLHGLFSTLRDDDITDAITTSSKLKPVRKEATKPPKPPALKHTSVTKTCRRKSVLKAKAKRCVKSKKLTLPLLRRENVPENNFMLNYLHWSQWFKVISPDDTDESWTKRRGDARGFRKNVIFRGKTALPALYEVSVQTHFKTRRVVVFHKFVKHIPANIVWESRLLGRSDIRRQVDQVVKSGCSVFVRRAPLIRHTRALSAITSLRKYDYAWRISRKRPNHRTVVKGDVKISDEVY